ncbi:hypothetical protein B296_00024162 [Ensete ventricosum]|uniref:Uncharacterized protein n=1 Tax=Ensete ventricosum TaxID=4639 RepID=A0A426YSK4_ENSVE|nr:hypothetical protein B296_00024162 [Ensete ventricosum]
MRINQTEQRQGRGFSVASSSRSRPSHHDDTTHVASTQAAHVALRAPPVMRPRCFLPCFWPTQLDPAFPTTPSRFPDPYSSESVFLLLSSQQEREKMQSGYGGVSEIQQFMVESCGPSLFSIASANPGAGAAPTDIHHPAVPHPLKYHPLAHPQPPALPPHFSHFHTIPITQQLFQQPAVHQFQLFHHHPQQQQQQQYLEPMRLIPQHPLGLDQESGPENSASPTRIIPGGGGGGGGPSFLAPAMGFKLAVDESSGGGSRKGINDDDAILQGDDGSESRLHHWQRDDESAIKELSW